MSIRIKSATGSEVIVTENDHELALLQRIGESDSDALTELFRIYHPRLFKFVFRLTGAYGTADELANDVMLAVWRQAKSFRGESKVSTWIFGIAYRQTMNRVTRNKLRLVSDGGLEDLAIEPTVNFETRDWLEHGVRSLSAVQQTTVFLVFYLGLSYEETAQVTQCPVNTVKTRMFHARRKLRELLPTTAIADSTMEAAK